jgi:hypothetical protein
METHVHNRHDHLHGAACGHLAVRHEDHVDYVHDGHLHHPHGDHVDEHELGENDLARCDPNHACDSHPVDHVHGVGCEHVAIPHAGHIDYIVAGHVHRQHGEHCDDHGELRLA